MALCAVPNRFAREVYEMADRNGSEDQSVPASFSQSFTAPELGTAISARPGSDELNLRGKLVANATDGFYEMRLSWVVTEFSANLRNQHVNATIAR